MDIDREHSLVLRESAVRPSGEVIVAYDASAIFSAEDHEEGEEPSSSTLLSRVQHIQQTHFNIQHSITVGIVTLMLNNTDAWPYRQASTLKPVSL
jgi:hypothetical protein